MDTVNSILVGMLILCIVVGLIRRTLRAVSWCMSLLIVMQIGYILGTTSLNNLIPFSALFTQDVLTSVAGLFPGTIIETGFLTVARFLSQIFRSFGVTIHDLWVRLGLRDLVQPVIDGFHQIYG